MKHQQLATIPSYQHGPISGEIEVVDTLLVAKIFSFFLLWIIFKAVAET
jgi:hypothetical protein